MKLQRLIEFTRKDILEGEITDVYEVYSGSWVQLYTTSGNPYCHTEEEWKTRFAEYEFIQTAEYMVLCGPRYVGHWNSIGEVRQFIWFYLRGQILNEVF